MRCSRLLLFALIGTAPVMAQEPRALDARLSPDGLRVAFRVAGAQGVELRSLVAGLPLETAIVLGDDSVEPDSVYVWTPDARRIVFTGARDGHLYILPVAETATGAAPRDLTPDIRGRARVVGFTDSGMTVLAELPGRWPSAPDLYRIDLGSGERTLVATNDGLVQRWMTDESGTPRIAVRAGEDGHFEIVRVRGDTITPIYSCDPDDVCDPLAFHPDRRVWMRSSRGRAAPALVLLDPVMMEEVVVRPDMSGDPHAAFMSDSAQAHDLAQLADLLDTTEPVLRRSEANGARALVVTSDSLGRSLHLYDRWAGTVTPLFPLVPADQRALAAVAQAPVPDPSRLVEAELTYLMTANDIAIPETTIEREIERRTVAGRDVWRVIDRARVPTYEPAPLDTMALQDMEFEPTFTMTEATGMVDAADTVMLDAATLRPITRRTGGPITMRLDFGERQVSGVAAGPSGPEQVRLALEAPVWSDGAALDLIVAALPIAPGYTARFRIFDVQVRDTVTIRLSVEDAEPVSVEAGRFEVWRVTIASLGAERPQEVWLVRRTAPHYVVRGTLRTGDFERTIELVDGEDIR